MKMNDDKESCYFFNPGKINSCSILNHPCDITKSRQLCSFHKTELQYYQDRNRAVELNRQKGNCSKCKYMDFQCDIIPINEEENNEY
ncbi:hypothetical protein [Ruminococcus flavefaciens]|uniref:hypothetical protein n=1 Tax=Ruminococcus flavefaciens TaxID=1265 RepID=UPI0026EBC0E8|nr:hypothetical protein [Ruminococcus flavefaciens]